MIVFNTCTTFKIMSHNICRCFHFEHLCVKCQMKLHNKLKVVKLTVEEEYEKLRHMKAAAFQYFGVLEEMKMLKSDLIKSYGIRLCPI